LSEIIKLNLQESRFEEVKEGESCWCSCDKRWVIFFFFSWLI